MEELPSEEETARQRPLAEVDSNAEVKSDQEVKSSGEVTIDGEVDSNEKGEASRQRFPFGTENQDKRKWFQKVATFCLHFLVEFVTHALVFWTFHWIIQ